jgi:hypothetical protein
MDYFTVKSRFENDFLIKLIRRNFGPLFLSFIFKEYKQYHIVSIPFHTLKVKLILHLEEIKYDIPDKQEIEEYSKNILEMWCRDDYQLLRRYYNSKGEVIVELTSHSERGIRWVEELGPKEFVGTESRFLMIYNMLKELVSGTNAEPERRIKELEEEKRKINSEIREIKESGHVNSFSEFQVRERFQQLSLMSRELLSDFKEVDYNFRNLVKDFYIKGLEEGSKGDLLGVTLDGYTELMNSPQGRSFSGFWQFLLADMGSDKINEMVSEVYSLGDEKGVNIENRLLFNLKNYLYQSGEKIVDTNHRLAEKLNRVISDPKRRDNKRLNSLIQDIKTGILQKSEIKDDNFIKIDGFPEISLVNERPLQLPQSDKVTETVILEPETIKNLSELFSLQYFEREKISKNISTALKKGDRIKLSQILNEKPVEFGVEEIITYFDIAMDSPKNSVLLNEKIKITYRTGVDTKLIEVPEVIFCR